MAELSETAPSTTEKAASKTRALTWIWDVLLIGVLILGGAFRLVGLNWDQGQHLHPDERFLTMVETSIRPPALSDYFNTDISTFNPHNVGHTFFVYGTLPIYIVYYVGQATGMSGYDSIHLVGRVMSALVDVGTILLVFLIANRLYRRTKISLLAAALLAFSVLPIQLSHFFAVDTFTTFFIYLAIYFAVQVLTRPLPERSRSTAQHFSWQTMWADAGSMWPYALFGIALGCAMASKVSSLPLAALLPLAAWINWTKLPGEERPARGLLIWRNLVLGGILAFLTFRIFQPYAFSGPGFFGLIPNDLWLQNLKELSVYSSGEADFPPALQWARRPIWFSWQNMVLWGLGLPLGLAAWAGFLWMGWRMLKGEWRQHLLLWSWTGVYFLWQSIGFTRSMRYQLPIYPALALMAAWLIVSLWEKRREAEPENGQTYRRRGWAALGVVLGVVVLVGTLAWAFAFTRIYTRPHTRVQASEWIYENVPGPLTLEVQADGQTYSMPTSVSSERLLDVTSPVEYRFTAEATGVLNGMSFDQLSDPFGEAGQIKTLVLEILTPEGDSLLAAGRLGCDFVINTPETGCGQPYLLLLDSPLFVEAGQDYYLRLRLEEVGAAVRLTGAPQLEVQTETALTHQILPDFGPVARPGSPLNADVFTANRTGSVTKVFVPRLYDLTHPDSLKEIRLNLYQMPDIGKAIASATATGTFEPGGGNSDLLFDFEPAAQIQEGTQYMLQVALTSGEGTLAVYAQPVALETSWDDPLPVPLNRYNPYPSLYRGGLNFEMYFDDDSNKLQRFTSTLDQAEYLFMSSNRQWGTTVRVPERYPLTTQYYRSLIGCPVDKDVFWCYAVAEPGMFLGQLGYELVYAGTSYPNLGQLEFNTQFAEEAFSVYDHPKTMVFRKTDSYDPQAVRDILGQVDLSAVVRLSPAEASGFKGNLLLPKDRLAGQQAGGTWAQIFPPDSPLNRSQPLAAAVWYVSIALLGWLVYPVTRLAFTGLADRGYAFSRLTGLLLLALVSWWAGSVGIAVTRGLLSAVAALLALVGIVLAVWRRSDLAAELRRNWRTYAWVEGLALMAFLAFLLVRLGNPDLWHPYHGGEKPMDLAYLNAVLKSTSFPPYDPWFAGGYINYYYYGFVLVGMPIKLLGIDPAIAYNLVLPTLFSVAALGAYSIVWNLIQTSRAERTTIARRWAVSAGLAGLLAFLILGNLGTVRMLWQGVQTLGSAGQPVTDASLPQRLSWAADGTARFLAGEKMPYGPGDWYWKPSRAIQPENGNEITEFPAFTFLYADLHAHMMALPVTLFALAWALSTWLDRWRWAGRDEHPSRAVALISIFVAAVAIGSLRAINTWDLPVYLVLAAASLAGSAWVHTRTQGDDSGRPDWTRKFTLAAGSVLLLTALVVLLYQPFARWYGQGYTSIDLQESWRTGISSYLVHWGVFLFVLVSWLIWETRDWMAKTPVSALRKLKPYENWIRAFFIAMLIFLAGLMYLRVVIALIALPLAVWCAVLLLRPGQPQAKRAALVMAGSALVLTIVVEVVVLQGDINRMNTVFKFYLQAWTLLSLASAASLFWLLPAVQSDWRPSWSYAWQAGLALFVFSAALFPLTASYDKMNTRISDTAPNSLDGTAYMLSSTYWDFDQQFSLAPDYQAIHWLQQNIEGSPVIVEGHTVEYHWGSRYSINTGLPGVVGYQWHQIQQRALLPSTIVLERVDAVNNFYLTTSPEEAQDFLKRYDVRYIILGPMERSKYAGPGLEKFNILNGQVWKSVYDQNGVTIYEVTTS